MLKLEEQIEQKLTEALRARNELAKGTYRLLKAAIKNERIRLGKEFTEADLLKVLRRELKKRHEASVAFQQGHKPESANQELAEAELIKELLPKELTEEEIVKVIQSVISEGNLAGPESFGLAMKKVMAKLAGRAEGSLVSKLLKDQLSL
ncbi:GatB/YqeY domain-containing protein [Patescibacteria group bacterium]|nr:GatB/YqeY domain-containing protein [Patescibacteria group bacterium]